MMKHNILNQFFIEKAEQRAKVRNRAYSKLISCTMYVLGRANDEHDS